MERETNTACDTAVNLEIFVSGVTTSVCHRTYIYQDGKLIYTNK